MQRELRTKLPALPTEEINDDSAIRQADRTSKQKGKEYADSRRHAKPKDIQPGDYVIVQQRHRNKFTTTFNKDPVKVIKVNGSQITFKDKGGQIHRRNSAQVKNVHSKGNHDPADDDIDGDIVIQNQANDMAVIQPPNQPELQGDHTNEEIPLPKRSNRTRKLPDYYHKKEH